MTVSKPHRVPHEAPLPRKRSIVPAFDPGMFLDNIGELGLDFRWSRAIACPCQLNSDTDQWDPTCTLCSGDGWWYINPESETERHEPAASRDYLELKCAFSQAGVDPKITENFGHFEFADAVMVMQNQCRVAFRDRFIGVQQEMAWTELLVRDEASALVPIGKSLRTTTQQRSAMRYEPVRINFAAKLIGNVLTRYYEGTDWILREATAIEPWKMEWLPSRGPADGELYTVHYVCRPVWIVDSATYGVFFARGPADGIKGVPVLQQLPTAFKVKLDFLTPQRGT